jgi:type III secretion protein C
MADGVSAMKCDSGLQSGKTLRGGVSLVVALVALSLISEPGAAANERPDTATALAAAQRGVSATGPASARLSQDTADAQTVHEGDDESGLFVANESSVQGLFDALAAGLGKPVIASSLAKAKRVTGRFDVSRPGALLARLSATMSLVSYDDGTSIYVYDATETKTAMVAMEHATLGVVRTFVRETRLLDSRYALRGDDMSKTFYVSGPPIYVNLVTAAARYLDRARGNERSGRSVVKLMQLRNSFVNDRAYTMRGQQIVIPGISTVLNRIYGDPNGVPGGYAGRVLERQDFDANDVAFRDRPPSQSVGLAPASRAASQSLSLLERLPAPSDRTGSSEMGELRDLAPGQTLRAPAGVRAVAYPDTNSVILVGRPEVVQEIEQLIRALDLAKRQIELSLWIIDIKKGKLEQLGIVWQAAVKQGQLGVGFNAGANLSTLDGGQFLASIQAMSLDGNARVVSRPILLTQENVPAIFDNNQTFYTQVVGERIAQLDHVTYGTLISVLSRLTETADQVEMQVDVEDGNANGGVVRASAKAAGLPLVNRTEIHTVARVPTGKSLLIGGNTVDNVARTDYKIPGLGDIPFLGALFRGHTETREQVVRLYLIQPTLVPMNASWQEGQEWTHGDPDRNAMLRSTVKLLQPFMGKAQ